nr:hypothetical protein [Tanacetum cinerariifolium]
MSINSGDHTGSKTASKAAMLSCSTQSKPLLFLDQLEVDVTGTIVVMIGRVWDVNAVIGRYLSTDFVVSDSKGNMIHCTAKSSVAHNFLRLKEGGIYSVKNFVVLPNKDEVWIFRHDMFMIEFDGETTARKGQSLRVTLWGELGDVLVEKKTKHAGVCAMVLTGMSGKEYNNKLYLSSTSFTVFYDDDDIPCLHELREDDRYRLEVVVADDTAHTVVVMFNDTATELLKCSAESLMGTKDENSNAKDELNLSGYKESHWNIIPNASAEDGASSSTASVTANDVESPVKIVTKPPTVCTPIQPNEGKKQKGHALEDLDVDEVSGPQENTGNSNAKVTVDTQKKRKRYIDDGSKSA